VPGQAFEEVPSEQEALTTASWGKSREFDSFESSAEAVKGLKLWLMVLCLEEILPEVNAWCEEMGAATVDEVMESKEDLADALGDRLSKEQREALLAEPGCNSNLLEDFKLP